MNYFELFGLEESPVADKAQAAKKYFELQKKFHPDFFTNENEADKEDALMQSAAINKAYNIFRDADKTLEYFLQLKGVISTDEKYSLPPDFLMEMMELNESLDEADNTQLHGRLNAYENELSAGVEALLVPNKAAALTTVDLEVLKTYYYKKKYLKRILDRMGD